MPCKPTSPAVPHTNGPQHEEFLSGHDVVAFIKLCHLGVLQACTINCYFQKNLEPRCILCHLLVLAVRANDLLLGWSSWAWRPPSLSPGQDGPFKQHL